MAGNITRLPQFQKKAIDLCGDEEEPDGRIPTPEGPGYSIEGFGNSEDYGKNAKNMQVLSARRAFSHLSGQGPSYFGCNFYFNQVCFFF